MFELGKRKIGDGFPPLVIAEIGINHNGCIKTAKAMVDSAKRAGVEVVKIQSHVISDEMSSEAKKVIPGNADKSIYDIMKDCSLSFTEEVELKEYIESNGMMFLSTPFSRKAALQLEDMDVNAYKIGSGECNNYPLIKLVASFGKPMIISTGMNDIESIKKTEEILIDSGVNYCFLHTTNLYPTPSNLVRLGAMQEMMKQFKGIEIGLSDHTTSNLACFSAVALGANILERHYTDSMNREGPDIVNSMDESACKELINGAREISLMRGGTKKAATEEQVTIDFAFATVVTTESIKKGEEFNDKNLWVKRPGTGSILAKDYEGIIGKKAKKDLPNDYHLSWDDIDG